MTRRRHGHPFWFILAFGTCITALLSGDVVVTLVSWALCCWLVTR